MKNVYEILFETGDGTDYANVSKVIKEPKNKPTKDEVDDTHDTEEREVDGGAKLTQKNKVKPFETVSDIVVYELRDASGKKIKLSDISGNKVVDNAVIDVYWIKDKSGYKLLYSNKNINKIFTSNSINAKFKNFIVDDMIDPNSISKTIRKTFYSKNVTMFTKVFNELLSMKG